MALQQWAMSRLSKLLPIDEESLEQIITHTNSLPDQEAATHLKSLLGDTPEAADFINDFNNFRSKPSDVSKQVSDNKRASRNGDTQQMDQGKDQKFAPPAGAPPSYSSVPRPKSTAPPRPHNNPVIEAAHVRARDEQQMQNLLQNVQMQNGIYNSEIEPEHDTDYYCGCSIHNYQRVKFARLGVQTMWSKAVMYPGEKAYHNNYKMSFSYVSNPYRFQTISPYGYWQTNSWGPSRPRPDAHARWIHQTIALNASLNQNAQTSIDSKEPKVNIWEEGELESMMSKTTINGSGDHKKSNEKATLEKRRSTVEPATNGGETNADKPSRFSSFRKSIGIKSSDERQLSRATKQVTQASDIRNAILAEEQGRWQDDLTRELVTNYQAKVGMTNKIADLRKRHAIQYLHLLRAGYFEPIPVAWAGSASNPLKFSIEAEAGWRGITPTWRGYEDTAEERLYWVLNHREGTSGTRLKPDFISAMNMARARMASAVEPPPEYFAADDTCHTQHTSSAYSKQVMPTPFRAYDRPELPTDDTMILLDVSGSMDFDPLRPNYNQYLITGYTRSTQPKNKDVAKAVIRRFADAMANHDHAFSGYDLTTFSSEAQYIGTINHRNLNSKWRNIRLGGGTRVMTGWQKVKDLHFQKHSESATHHPIYGWQAGPETPMLRLLLLLDGEATDMDEFELDLLGLSWAHVTIFLIGVDGCPHHHRHANELQRISDVNHHVSFVDAQGNAPERFVTHELLKRHLGYEISFSEFEHMEELPPYSE